VAARLVDLYREHGPAIFARCRRLLGADEAAVAATLDAFARRARDPGIDLAVAAEEICLQRLPPGRLAVLEDGASDPAAEERFRGRYLVAMLPAIERAERPPLVLRWVWIFGPIFVACAMTAMFFAARSARQSERAAALTPGLEVYAERGGHTYRVPAGATLRHDQHVRLVVVPAGAAYALVAGVDPDGGRVLASLGPFAANDARVAVPDEVALTGPGRLRLLLLLSSKPLAQATVAIVLERRALGNAPLAIPAVEVSFDAQVE